MNNLHLTRPFQIPLDDAEFALALIHQLENDCITGNLATVTIDSALVLEVASIVRAYVVAMRATNWSDK